MINLNEFINFQLIKSEKENCIFYVNWKVPQNLPYFTGHFPSNPVLPAVAILDISIEMIKRISNTSYLEIKNIKTGKFYSIIRPNREVQIRVENKNPGEWIINWLDGTQLEKKLAKIHLFFS